METLIFCRLILYDPLRNNSKAWKGCQRLLGHRNIDAKSFTESFCFVMIAIPINLLSKRT